jgi:plastocyanin
MKRTLLAALALPVLLPVTPASAGGGGGCRRAGPEREAPVGTRPVVRIDHTCFDRAVLAVRRGDRVVWQNASPLEHNISGPGIDFAEIEARGSFAQSFDEPGWYPYACTLHPGMAGALHVVAAGAPGAAAPTPAAADPAAAPAEAAAPVRAERVAATRDAGGGTPWGAFAAVALLLVGGGLLARRVRPARRG